MFNMVDLVVQIIFRFAKFLNINLVYLLLNFNRAERLLGRPYVIEKGRTFF